MEQLNIPDGSYILQDNAAIHTTEIVQNYQLNRNLRMINSVPYSCDFNPIELLFNVVKKKLKKRNVTKYNVKNEFIDVCNSISKQKISNFINHVYDQFSCPMIPHLLNSQP